MSRSITLLFIAVVFTLVAFSVAAADNGFYLGGSVGQSSYSVGEFSSDDFDGDGTGYKAFAGGRFLTFLGIEGAYVDFGDIEGDASGQRRRKLQRRELL
jgi:hypothetical protein